MDESMLSELFKNLMCEEQPMNQTNLTVALSESLGGTSASASQRLSDVSTPVTNNLMSSTGSSSAAAEETNRQEARELRIQGRIQALMHVRDCIDANCRFRSCQWTKQVLTHWNICKSRIRGGCHMCKQLISLYCYHALVCQDTNCPATFCHKIKSGLKKFQLKPEPQVISRIRNLCL
ncbi:PREDICTED: CREB-binding protein-like isoform X2 [Vollenhovia emeryi]|uniref:CREB-binding protein-like isoform X2 n=1 Tax=Vollenhovia emeryi TaxID=411798 RepID=UPI0005F3CF0D|nr:PREDICTED: CREB-binding protein-like isoform X2 [Vollenhovia emeryi]